MKKLGFYSFWFAQASISLADVVYIMVITTYIYQKTGSALISSMFPLTKAIAKLIAGFTSPILIQRFSYSKLLVNLQIMKAALISFLLVAFTPITSHILLLLLFIVFISFIEGWGGPLISSVVPKIVDSDKLVKANSALSTTNQSVQIAGYTFTGFLVIKFGHMETLVISGVLYWISSICLNITRRFFQTENHQVSNKSKWALMKEGWVYLWRIPTLRIVTMMDVIEGIARQIWVGAITLVYVKEILHKGDQWWGFINSSYYIGTIIGGMITIALAKKIQKHLIKSMAIGSFLFGILTLLYGLNSTPIFALLLCVAMGPAYQIRDVAQQTSFQSSINLALLPQVYASRGILLSTITASSTALVGFVSDHFGIKMVYILGAILIFISAIMSFALNHKIERNSSISAL